ncbi:MAG: hypothetical protein ACOYS2_03640 [Patescibacteria group bacterium]
MSDSKNVSQPIEPNPFENFEAAYMRERETQEELERIEMAYAKTVERYKDYADCVAFASYIKTIEKVFAEAKKRNWDTERIKNSLIEAKIDIVSRETGIGKDVLRSIYDDFRSAGASISRIREVVEMMVEKYRENPECVEFVLFLENVLTNFGQLQGEKMELDQIKERLIRARMQVISSDGKPELSTLEGIYREFMDELRK